MLKGLDKYKLYLDFGCLNLLKNLLLKNHEGKDSSGYQGLLLVEHDMMNQYNQRKGLLDALTSCFKFLYCS